MMNHKEIAAVVAGVVPAVKEFIDKALWPINAKFLELENRKPEKGDPGEPGQNGADGKSIDADEVASLIKLEVAKEVASIPPASDGKSVTVDDVRPMIEELVGKIPVAKDGKDVDPVEVSALVTAEVQKAVAAFPPAKDGKDVDPDVIAQMIADTVSKLPQAKDGNPGTDGAPGRDGLTADECLVPDDLAVDVGKAIALLAESPPIVPKASTIVVNNALPAAAGFKAKKITRDKTDGSLTITEQAE